MKRIAFAVPLTVLLMAVTASPSAALVTVGQVPAAAPGTNCIAPVDRVQPTVTSGTSYAVPANGKITSWSTFAGALIGSLKLKVYRPVAGAANTYTVVGQDTPRTLTVNTLNTFTSNITVQKDDLVGLNSTTGNTSCIFEAIGDRYFRSVGPSDTANGGLVALANPIADSRLNISAVLDPTNSVTFGGVSRNKKKGTATLTVNVPNAGQLSTSGTGLKVAETAVDKTLTAAGTVKFKLKAKGKKLQKLNDTGKVKVNPKFTFTPTGGTATTTSTKVKLKKN